MQNELISLLQLLTLHPKYVSQVEIAVSYVWQKNHVSKYNLLISYETKTFPNNTKTYIQVQFKRYVRRGGGEPSYFEEATVSSEYTTYQVKHESERHRLTAKTWMSALTWTRFKSYKNMNKLLGFDCITVEGHLKGKDFLTILEHCNEIFWESC